MSKFQPFEFNEDVISRIREAKEIPVHFYNKDGQILIYQKSDASESEIERLLKFVDQGIYYDVNDSEALGLKKTERDVPEGLTDTKLISQQVADDMTANTTELFDELKKSSMTSFQTRRTTEQLTDVFDSFENQPDAMVGLVNIIEMMKDQDASSSVQLSVKRTVVAMAMKTRGMQAQSHRDKKKLNELSSILMTSAMLCDIGTMRMNLPTHAGLSDKEMIYIRNHPLMSYMMLAHDPGIDPRIKHRVLCHHRPLKEGVIGNNYPETKWLLNRLKATQEKYADQPDKQNIMTDIKEQIGTLGLDIPYDEDLNIIALASEFASLTSDVPWREAHSAVRAVQMIINNSYFTYSDRILREFLDYTAISMCDNEKILREGDFIIVSSRGRDEKTYFEVCEITSSSRYQSRPGINRIATIRPIIEKSPKISIAGFDLDSIKPDPRFAYYELSKDDTRHIAYCVNPHYDRELYDRFKDLTSSRKAR